MPYIQVNKTGSSGYEKHKRFSITIPKEIVKFMDWKKGDELEFRLVKGNVIISKISK